MASVNSTISVLAPLSFPPEFVERIARFEDMVNRRGAMRWAKQYGLGDDLRQLALLEIARILPKFDPALATSLDHFVGACLNRCLADCMRVLKREHRQITDGLHASFDVAHDDEGNVAAFDELQALHGEFDPVLDSVVRTRANARLRIACEELPLRQHEIVGLVLRDFTDKEIAEELGVSVQSVNKSRLAAVANLRKLVPTVSKRLN